ncbi:MAG: type II glyceraldehyde-3-phosphate dehydrogenase [Candidatus Aenigmarchaeota archaeon]|nr:type II glyceraldehyde-3-phosphate dehydrogenase [Candidatus Aenigmarchaeota archaeon]
MINVCVNGYGTIGKRVADAAKAHSKIRLVGVSKYSADADASIARMQGIDVFVPKESAGAFESKGVEVSGTVEELLDKADSIVDASPDGVGRKNRVVYEEKGKKAVFQGGEEAGIGLSFNARSNFEKALNQNFIRVVSCNTTGYCRILKPLTERYKIKHVFASLIRRGADLNDAKGSQLNSVEWKAKSHHASDVQSVIDVPMSSIAFKVPHTHSHINSMFIEFDGEKPGKDDIYELFRNERVALLNTAATSSQIVEAARDLGLKRYDIFMPCLLVNTYMANGNSVFLSFAVPQESIVVPENIDAIIAQNSAMSREESMRTTDKLLGIPDIKEKLEKAFS